MRKLIIHTLSAAAVMFVTAATPFPSLAAAPAYRLPSFGGNAIVIGQGGQDCLPGIGNLNGNCDLSGGWGSGPILPEITPPDFTFPTPELPGPELPDKPDQGEEQDDYQKAVVDLVNAERAKAGLSPLTVNSDVAKAAQTRAQEIKSTFSHTRPDGSSFGTALSQAGVSYRGSGENIAYGQNTPEEVMRGWMNSSGHRANILNKDFTSIGVGHYEDANGTDYWTQLFIY